MKKLLNWILVLVLLLASINLVNAAEEYDPVGWGDHELHISQLEYNSMTFIRSGGEIKLRIGEGSYSFTTEEYDGQKRIKLVKDNGEQLWVYRKDSKHYVSGNDIVQEALISNGHVSGSVVNSLPRSERESFTEEDLSDLNTFTSAIISRRMSDDSLKNEIIFQDLKESLKSKDIQATQQIYDRLNTILDMDGPEVSDRAFAQDLFRRTFSDVELQVAIEDPIQRRMIANILRDKLESLKGIDKVSTNSRLASNAMRNGNYQEAERLYRESRTFLNSNSNTAEILNNLKDLQSKAREHKLAKQAIGDANWDAFKSRFDSATLDPASYSDPNKMKELEQLRDLFNDAVRLQRQLDASGSIHTQSSVSNILNSKFQPIVDRDERIANIEHLVSGSWSSTEISAISSLSDSAQLDLLTAIDSEGYDINPAGKSASQIIDELKLKRPFKTRIDSLSIPGVISWSLVKDLSPDEFKKANNRINSISNSLRRLSGSTTRDTSVDLSEAYADLPIDLRDQFYNLAGYIGETDTSAPEFAEVDQFIRNLQKITTTKLSYEVALRKQSGLSEEDKEKLSWDVLKDGNVENIKLLQKSLGDISRLSAEQREELLDPSVLSSSERFKVKFDQVKNPRDFAGLRAQLKAFFEVSKGEILLTISESEIDGLTLDELKEKVNEIDAKILEYQKTGPGDYEDRATLARTIQFSMRDQDIDARIDALDSVVDLYSNKVLESWATDPGISPEKFTIFEEAVQLAYELSLDDEYDTSIYEMSEGELTGRLKQRILRDANTFALKLNDPNNFLANFDNSVFGDDFEVNTLVSQWAYIANSKDPSLTIKDKHKMLTLLITAKSSGIFVPELEEAIKNSGIDGSDRLYTNIADSLDENTRSYWISTLLNNFDTSPVNLRTEFANAKHYSRPMSSIISDLSNSDEKTRKDAKEALDIMGFSSEGIVPIISEGNLVAHLISDKSKTENYIMFGDVLFTPEVKRDSKVPTEQIFIDDEDVTSKVYVGLVGTNMITRDKPIKDNKFELEDKFIGSGTRIYEVDGDTKTHVGFSAFVGDNVYVASIDSAITAKTKGGILFNSEYDTINYVTNEGYLLNEDGYLKYDEILVGTNIGKRAFNIDVGVPVWKTEDGKYFIESQGSGFEEIDLDNLIDGGVKDYKLNPWGGSAEDAEQFIETRQKWQGFLGTIIEGPYGPLQRTEMDIYTDIFEKNSLFNTWRDEIDRVLDSKFFKPQEWEKRLCEAKDLFFNKELPSNTRFERDAQGIEILTQSLQARKESIPRLKTNTSTGQDYLGNSISYEISWIVKPAQYTTKYSLCANSCEFCLKINDPDVPTQEVEVAEGETSSGFIKIISPEEFDTIAICSIREIGGAWSLIDEFKMPVVGKDYSVTYQGNSQNTVGGSDLGNSLPSNARDLTTE